MYIEVDYPCYIHCTLPIGCTKHEHNINSIKSKLLWYDIDSAIGNYLVVLFDECTDQMYTERKLTDQIE